MMKRKNSKIIVTSLLSAWILMLTFSGCAFTKIRNINEAKRYAAAHYGGQSLYVNYTPPVNAASGMRPAKVEFETTNFTYTLEVENGMVIGDNYSEQYAGWLVHEEVFETMIADNTYPDFGGREIFFNFDFVVTDPTLLQMDLNLSHAKDYTGIMKIVNQAGGIGTAYIYVNVSDTERYENEEWLYDFYLTCQNNLEYYSLSYYVGIPGGRPYTAAIDGGTSVNGPTLDKDEFFGLFH